MVGDSEGFSGVSVLKPAEIMAHLNQYVIGQTEAKKSLAVAVYNHVLTLALQHMKRISNYKRAISVWLGQRVPGRLS